MVSVAQEIEPAIIQALAQDPEATAEQIAARLGCAPVQVKRSPFYRRVIIIRLGREPNPTDERIHSLLD